MEGGREWERREFDGGKHPQQNVAQMDRLPVSKQDGLRREASRRVGQKPEKTQREAAREGERGRGLAPDLGTL